MWHFKITVKIFLAVIAAAMCVTVASDTIFNNVYKNEAWRLCALYLFGVMFFDKTIDFVNDIIERWGI